MSAFNIVRFRVKVGSEQAFIDAHRNVRPNFKGFVGANLVRTGDRTFCIVGEWRDHASLVGARPEMIEFLDSFRHMLEDLGGGLGVSDPVSGESVAKLSLGGSAKKTSRKGAKTKKAAKRTTKKTAKKAAKKKAQPKSKAKKKK